MSLKNSLVAVAALALVPSCTKTHKPDDKIEIAGPTKTADDKPGKPGAARDAQKRPEDAYNPKAVRLFDDAVRSFNEQRQLRVWDYPALEKKFKAVTQADITFAEAHYNLGVLYERMRRPDDAREAYRTALEKKPTLKQAAENLAVMLQNEGKPADAVAVYQDILRKYPEDGAARARLAELYRESGDVERARKYAREALMREPQNLTAYKVMMRTFLDAQPPNLNMAKLVALRAQKLAEKDPELHYTMGLILAKEGDEAGAIAQFKGAIAERDDYTAARLQVATIAVKHGDWANAEEQYRKIVQYDPRNAAAHLNLGVAYKGLGQVDKAMQEYDAAMKADESLPQPLFDMGLLMQKSKDAPERAIEFYKKFLAASHDNVPADHPVFENIRECEQLIRALAEAKAAEEKAKQEEAAAKAREAAEKKAAEEKAREEEAAKKQAEKEARQKSAKEAVDAAMKGGEGGDKKDKADKTPDKPSDKPADKPKDAPQTKPVDDKAQKPAPRATGAAAREAPQKAGAAATPSDEPTEGP